MIDLQNKLSAESNKRDIGKTFEVLVEGYSKRSREDLFGRTGQNKVVVFPKQNYHIGDFVQVKITDASSATLLGEAINYYIKQRPSQIKIELVSVYFETDKNSCHISFIVLCKIG